jgi:hypothetical protein
MMLLNICLEIIHGTMDGGAAVIAMAVSHPLETFSLFSLGSMFVITGKPL